MKQTEPKMLTASAVAARVGRHSSAVTRACAAGRVPGAKHEGTPGVASVWMIPDTPEAIEACRAQRRGRKKGKCP